MTNNIDHRNLLPASQFSVSTSCKWSFPVFSGESSLISTSPFNIESSVVSINSMSPASSALLFFSRFSNSKSVTYFDMSKYQKLSYLLWCVLPNWSHTHRQPLQASLWYSASQRQPVINERLMKMINFFRPGKDGEHSKGRWRQERSRRPPSQSPKLWRRLMMKWAEDVHQYLSWGRSLLMSSSPLSPASGWWAQKRNRFINFIFKLTLSEVWQQWCNSKPASQTLIDERFPFF